MPILSDFPTPVKSSMNRKPCGAKQRQRTRTLAPSERYTDPTPPEDRGPESDDLVRGSIVGTPSWE